VTGFLVDDLDEAALAVTRVGALDRVEIAAKTRERFSADRMVDAYESVYRRLITPAAVEPAMVPVATASGEEQQAQRPTRELERTGSARELIAATTR
jgi:hypothetical protein